jgi:lantibiotic transport system permease protein
MTFTASLRSEFRKLKGTYLIAMVLVTALIVPFVLVFDQGADSPIDAWGEFYRDGTMVIVFAFFPLFLVLISTLLMQIEVRNNTWKQVLTTPQSFFHILLAKFVLLQMLALSFLIAYNLYMILSASLLDAMYGLNMLSYLEHWPEVIRITLMAYGASVGISALTFWLALRSKNFIAPIAMGLLLWIMHLFATLEFKWPYMDKSVFAIPLTLFSKKFDDERLLHQLLSLGYGVLFFTIAYLEFVMQRMQLGKYLTRNIASAKQGNQADS